MTRKNDEPEYKWWVPLTHAAPGGDFENTYPMNWLKPKTPDSSIKVSGMPDKNTPVVFNLQQTGRTSCRYA